jgi:uncharacterized protein (TIGR03545 family)
MKWIRWQGLTAFLVIVGGTTAFFVFFIDGLVKRAIEKTGTAIVGAKVELDDADVTLFPLGIELKRLQVTNPNAPMTNAVEVDRIAFSVDAVQKLRHKTLIDEMSLDDMRFDTDRKTSGALSKKQKAPGKTSVVKQLAEKISLPSLEIPDVRNILEREPLDTLNLVETVQNEIKTGREDWQARIDQLPDKKKLEEYRDRIKAIRKSGKKGLGGILGGVTGAVELREDLMGDLDRIKEARGALKKDLRTLQDRVREARNAPADDIRRLKEKYSLSPEGLSNFTRLLLGPKIAGWTDTALRWYIKARPYLDRLSRARKAGSTEVVKPVRGKGMDVRFNERDPMPDFLIRTAGVSVDIPAGKISGRLRNITGEQRLAGAPLTFELKGEGMKDVSGVALNGEFNRLDPAHPRDRVALSASGYRIRNAAISQNEPLKVTLVDGLADLSGKAEMEANAMDVDLSAKLRQASLKTDLPGKPNPLSKAMADTLSDVKGFSLEASITGTPEDYKIGLTSDLDRILKDAVGQQVRKQAAQFEQKLTEAVHRKVDPRLKELESRLGTFDPLVGELTSRLKIGDDLLAELEQSGKKGLGLPF